MRNIIGCLVFLNVLFLQVTGDVGAKPKHGVIKIEFEKPLIIDSISVDKNDPPMFARARRASGIFILAEKPELKIYRFNNEGKLLNSFLSQGEGRGEVKSLQDFQPIDDTLLVKAREKLIYFNSDGSIIQERKFNQEAYHSVFLNDETYINKILEWDDSQKPIRKLALFSLADKKPNSVLWERPDRRDLGITMIKGNMVYHLWITPDVRFTYLKQSKRVVCALSDSKTLCLKDLSGNILKTVTLDLHEIDIEEHDKESLLEGMAMFKRRAPELYKELVTRVPKKFFPIMALKQLPHDHFALFTPIGYAKYDNIKVFDHNLDYLYDLKLPNTILDKMVDPSKMNFFEKGLYFIETSGDENRYFEYHVKNLKNIFN